MLPVRGQSLTVSISVIVLLPREVVLSRAKKEQSCKSACGKKSANSSRRSSRESWGTCEVWSDRCEFTLYGPLSTIDLSLRVSSELQDASRPAIKSLHSSLSLSICLCSQRRKERPSSDLVRDVQASSDACMLTNWAELTKLHPGRLSLLKRDLSDLPESQWAQLSLSQPRF